MLTDGRKRMTREEKNKIRHLVTQLEVALRNGYGTADIHRQLDDELSGHLRREDLTYGKGKEE